MLIIKEDCRRSGDGCEKCMLELLIFWRNQEDPSWSKIVDVLIKMEMCTTAQKIAEKHGDICT